MFTNKINFTKLYKVEIFLNKTYNNKSFDFLIPGKINRINIALNFQPTLNYSLLSMNGHRPN